MRFKPAILIVTALATTARADNKPLHPELWMFDDKPITATSPAKGKDVVKIMGHIYARIFFDRSIQEVYGLTAEQNTLRVYELYDNGKIGVYDNVEVLISKKDFANKWVDLDILPDPAQMHEHYQDYGDIQGFYRPWIGNDEDHPFKETGRHAVFFSVTGPNHLKDPDRRAALVTVDFTGLDTARLRADAAVVKAASKAIGASEAKAASKGVHLPAKGQLHKAALASKTEKSIKLNNKDLVAVKVIVTGDSWEIMRNKLSGVIIERVADASVAVKDKAGKCTLVSNGVVTQEYVGGKFIADGGWSDSGAHEDLIDCANVFK